MESATRARSTEYAVATEARWSVARAIWAIVLSSLGLWAALIGGVVWLAS